MTLPDSPIHSTFIDTPEGVVHARLAGDGPALLMLHHTASAGAMFEALIAVLACDFQCIAPDTPGYGCSPPLGRPVSVPGYADAMLGVLDVLGVERTVIVGHHTGAAIGGYLAATHPQRIDRLILIGPPVLTDEQKSDLLARLPPWEVRADGAHLLETWQRIQRRMPPGAPLALIQREVWLTLGAAEQAHHTYRAVFEHDVRRDLTTITCPALLMAGEHDSLAACIEPAQALMPSAQTRIFAGAGTYLCDTHTHIVADAIRAFVP